MQQFFRSKIGLEIALPITFVLVGTSLLVGFKANAYFVSASLLALLSFIGYLLYDTTYTIDNNRLIVRFGFLYRETIEISEVKSIRESNNPLSSPASSLDRLEIKYGRSGSVLVSPKKKLEFIETLKSINPEIQIFLKKSNT